MPKWKYPVTFFGAQILIPFLYEFLLRAVNFASGVARMTFLERNLGAWFSTSTGKVGQSGFMLPLECIFHSEGTIVSLLLIVGVAYFVVKYILTREQRYCLPLFAFLVPMALFVFAAMKGTVSFAFYSAYCSKGNLCAARRIFKINASRFTQYGLFGSCDIFTGTGDF